MSLLRRILRQRHDLKFRELLRHSGMLYIAGLITIVLTFGQQITTANLLGVNDYGRFAVILSSSTLILLLMDARTWELGTKMLARPILDTNHTEVVRITSWLTRIDLLLGIGGMLLIIVLAEPIATYLLKMPDLDWLVRLYGISLPFRILGAGAPVALVRMYDRFDWLSLKSVFYAVIRLVLISGAALLGAGLTGVVISAIVCEAVNMALLLGMVFLIWRQQMPGTRILDFARPQEFESGRKMLIELWFSATLRGLQLETFLPITALLTSPAQVGLLRSAMDVTDLIPRLTTPMSVVLSSTVVKTYEQDSRYAFIRLLKQATLLLGAMTIPMMAAIIFGGPLLLPSLLGSDFDGVGQVAALLTMGFGVNAIFLWTRPALVAAGLVREQNIIGIIWLIISTAGLFIFVPLYGAMGSGLVIGIFLMGYALTLVIVFYYRIRELRPLTTPSKAS